jgi:hypothetical protein
MAEVLELAQLAEHHGVTEVDVETGRVDAELGAERFASGVAPFKLLFEFVARLDLRGTARDDRELFLRYSGINPQMTLITQIRSWIASVSDLRNLRNLRIN